MSEISIIGGGRGNPNVAYPMALTADTPITLTNQSPRNIMLTGSASGVNVVLPDATTLSVGDIFNITNASSEFIFIKNSDFTLCECVPPTCKIYCYLYSNTAAAGSWTSNTDGLNSQTCTRLYEEFMSGASSSGYSLGWTATGTNGGIMGAASPRDGKDLSAQALLTQTNAAGSECISFHSTCTRFNGMAHMIKWGRVSVDALSDGTDTYHVDLGWGDTFTGAAQTDAVMVRYQSSSSVNWQTAVAATGTLVQTPSSLLVSTAINNITAIVNSTGTRADFYVGTTKIGTVTSGIPKDGEVLSPMARIVKTNGTTARKLYVDYCIIIAATLTGRV